jgi:lipopolysaccharide transport system permease protein
MDRPYGEKDEEPVGLKTAGRPVAAGTNWDAPEHVRVIEPTPGWARLDLARLWRYRELLYFLAWRDIKVRYKQTVLGVAWAVLQPVLTMAIFWAVFGRAVGVKSDGLPYPLFAFTALVPWTLFSYAMTQSSNSLVNSSHLISKVSFPRLAIPVAACIAGLLDFAISFGVLLLLLLGEVPGPQIVVLPLLVLLTMAAALAVGIWLSALMVRYRDVRYTIPFLAQIWLYATPVAYPSSIIHGKLRVVLDLNPMTGVIDGFRWSLLHTESPDFTSMLLSSVVTILALVAGLFYFRRMEQTFADVV